VPYNYFQYWTKEIYKRKQRLQAHSIVRRSRRKGIGIQEYVNLLNTHIREPYTDVLEAGCGWGRYIKNYPFCGVDINLNRLKIAKRHKSTVIRGDLTHLPFKDKSFEASYTIQVLMHIPNTHIKQALKEFIRVTRERILHIEVYSTKKRRLAGHCFNHNLKQLYHNLGINSIYYKRLASYKTQICVVLKVK